MGTPRAGILNDKSAAAATAFNRLELNPTDTINITEFGISHDGPANNTDTPAEYVIQRMSAVGTGAAGTPVKMNDDVATSLGTTALVENTADGATQDVLHRLFVPIVSGVIWVARPGNEFDCTASDFLGILNIATLPSGRSAATYIVWQE